MQTNILRVEHAMLVGQTTTGRMRIALPGTVINRTSGVIIYAPEPNICLKKIAMRTVGVLLHITGDFVSVGESVPLTFLGIMQTSLEKQQAVSRTVYDSTQECTVEEVEEEIENQQINIKDMINRPVDEILWSQIAVMARHTAHLAAFVKLPK